MHKRVPAGQTGEIAVKGDTVMQGYFNGKDTVKNEGVHIDSSGNRWVLTGDLGYMDSDGFIFFTGRKKRMIIISGYNVYPADIENVVLQLPFIGEACAVQGYQKNKPCVKLCVTLNQSMDKEQAIDKIQLYCKKNLAKFSCPRKIEILDSFPRTKMAKVDFMKLSDKYGKGCFARAIQQFDLFQPGGYQLKAIAVIADVVRYHQPGAAEGEGIFPGIGQCIAENQRLKGCPDKGVGTDLLDVGQTHDLRQRGIAQERIGLQRADGFRKCDLPHQFAHMGCFINRILTQLDADHRQTLNACRNDHLFCIAGVGGDVYFIFFDGVSKISV